MVALTPAFRHVPSTIRQRLNILHIFLRTFDPEGDEKHMYRKECRSIVYRLKMYHIKSDFLIGPPRAVRSLITSLHLSFIFIGSYAILLKNLKTLWYSLKGYTIPALSVGDLDPWPI